MPGVNSTPPTRFNPPIFVYPMQVGVYTGSKKGGHNLTHPDKKAQISKAIQSLRAIVAAKQERLRAIHQEEQELVSQVLRHEIALKELSSQQEQANREDMTLDDIVSLLTDEIPESIEYCNSATFKGTDGSWLDIAVRNASTPGLYTVVIVNGGERQPGKVDNREPFTGTAEYIRRAVAAQLKLGRALQRTFRWCD